MELIDLSIANGKVVSWMMKKLLDGTLNMQFEKVLTNFILFSKKHYIGWLHEKNAVERKLKYSGIILVRRDNPEIVKFLFRKIF
jgi:DNA polymerase elongation subunit (family B)